MQNDEKHARRTFRPAHHLDSLHRDHQRRRGRCGPGEKNRSNALPLLGDAEKTIINIYVLEKIAWFEVPQ